MKTQSTKEALYDAMENLMDSKIKAIHIEAHLARFQRRFACELISDDEAMSEEEWDCFVSEGEKLFAELRQCEDEIKRAEEFIESTEQPESK